MDEAFESVLRAAQAGGEWAWTRLYEMLSPGVLGYLRKQGSSDPEALLGEVWIHVARGIDRFEGPESAFRAWVFKIAHHRLVDEWRSNARRPTVLMPTDELPDEGVPADEGFDASVYEMLDSLTDEQKSVMLLRYGADLSIEQTAEALDKEPNAVKGLQHRAVRKLQKKFSLTRNQNVRDVG